MAMTIEFEAVQDGCCAFCNPVQLADYERKCAKARFYLNDNPYAGVLIVCEACLAAMQASLTSSEKRKIAIEPKIEKLFIAMEMRRTARKT